MKYINLGYNFIRKPLIVKTPPFHIQLEVTNACNLNCIMCTRSRMIRHPSFLKYEQFTKLFDDIRPAKINLFGLGEPLLNKDLCPMIKYSRSRKTPVALSSNLAFNSKEISDLVDSGLDLLKISIDAATKETYEQIRGKDLFETIVSNIKYINQLKEKTGCRTPHLRFNFALQNRNMDELEDAIKLAKDLNVESIYIQYLKFYDAEDRKKDIVGGISRDELLKRLIRANRLCEALGIRTNIPIWLRDFELFYNRFQRDYKSNNRQCYFPWLGTFIEANGDVRPCPVFAWRREVGVMGNILEEEFKNIWNGEKYLRFRRDIKDKRRPTNICERCLPFSLHDFFDIFTKGLPGFGK